MTKKFTKLVLALLIGAVLIGGAVFGALAAAANQDAADTTVVPDGMVLRVIPPDMPITAPVPQDSLRTELVYIDAPRQLRGAITASSAAGASAQLAAAGDTPGVSALADMQPLSDDAPTVADVGSWPELVAAIASAEHNVPDATPLTIRLTNDFVATGNAIAINQGRQIVLTSNHHEIPRTIFQTLGLQRHFTVTGTVAQPTQLTLGHGVTLSGGPAGNTNDSGGVNINADGILTMQPNSVIENCRFQTGAHPGAVNASGARARFIMEGGSIRNNQSSQNATVIRGAVSILSSTARAYIRGGEIVHNELRDIGTATARVAGAGGVAVHLGYLEMTGGVIAYNRYGNPHGSAYISRLRHAGGMQISGASANVVLTGGEIRNNRAFMMGVGEGSTNHFNNAGGGITIEEGNLTIGGSVLIAENTAARGGGLFIGRAANVTITGGEFRNNRAMGAPQLLSRQGGGAIYVQDAPLTQPNIAPNSYPQLTLEGGSFIGNVTTDAAGATTPATTPPANAIAATNIANANVLLNNHNINYNPTLAYSNRWTLLRDNITNAPATGELHTINLVAADANVIANGGAIIIRAGQNILLQSDATAAGAANRRVLTQTNANQRHFIVENGGSLTLGRGITLSGGAAGNSNQSGGVLVRGANARLELQSVTAAVGAVIIENNRYNRWENPGAIGVWDGTFVMNGGIIRNNRSSVLLAPTAIPAYLSAGAVSLIGARGYLHGGEIYSNLTANGAGATRRWGSSGSIAVTGANGHLTMTGGVIRNNTSLGGGTHLTEARHGTGGVIIAATGAGGGATFSGGEIRNNAAATQTTADDRLSGGGIHIASGNVTISGNILIANNTAARGGGVLLEPRGSLAVSGGTFRDNTATGPAAWHERLSGGGAIHVIGAPVTYPTIEDGTYPNLTVTGGVFEGNTATAGVQVPPTNANAATNIANADVLLNNNHINYRRVIYRDARWTALRANITSAPVSGALHTINLAEIDTNITAYNEAIVIRAGQNILLQSSATAAGAANRRTITQPVSAQRHFIVENGGTLTLGRGITLRGGPDDNTNNSGGVLVDGANARFVMQNVAAAVGGPIIEQNRWQIGDNAGAVNLSNSAVFVMQGGIIRNNETANSFMNSAGQVTARTGSRFYLEGGEIYGGTTNIGGGDSGGGGGAGGVSSINSHFEMTGGVIRNNTPRIGNNNASMQGSGGVAIHGGTAVLSGGEIRNNIAPIRTAIMMTTSYNVAGGISIRGGTVTIGGSVVIRDNEGLNGGIFLREGTLNINGGTIQGNTGQFGGGLAVRGTGIVNITGGQFIGNTATDGDGGAIYFAGVEYNYPYLLPGQYSRLTVASPVIFRNNSASTGASPPPHNAHLITPISNVAEVSVSLGVPNVANHPLNNYDINFRSRPYRATFNLNDGNLAGHGTADVVIIPEEGQPIGSVPQAPALTRNHPVDGTPLEFLGWSERTATGLSPIIPIAQLQARVLTGSTTFIARWDLVEHPITFDLDGGNVGGNPANVVVDVIAGTMINHDGVQRVPTPVRAGYELLWWRVYPGVATITSVRLGNAMPTQPMTYVAVWREMSEWERLRTEINSLPRGGAPQVVTIDRDITTIPIDAMITIPSNLNLTINTIAAANHTLTMGVAGQRHFNVQGDLTLGAGITLSGGAQGNTANSGGVTVRPGGNFTMATGSEIRNVNRTNINGGAVDIIGGAPDVATSATPPGTLPSQHNPAFPAGRAAAAVFNMQTGSVIQHSSGMNRGGAVHVVGTGVPGPAGAATRAIFNTAGDIRNSSLNGAAQVGGGAVSLQDNAHMVMVGGTIQDSQGSQGVILQTGDAANLQITGATAMIQQYSGVGVRIEAGEFGFSAGQIRRGTTGIHQEGGTVNMSGTALLGDATETNTSNSAEFGGGVLMQGGTFNMTGGAIRNSQAGAGGGVAMIGGTFNMNGASAVIANNTASAGGDPDNFLAGGGGVWVHRGQFNLQNGFIENNASYSATGVRVNAGGYLNMTGGTIRSNTSLSVGAPSGQGNGSAIMLTGQSSATPTNATRARMTMSGGTISGHNAGDGGAVWGWRGAYMNMSGGVIENNTATGSGGAIALCSWGGSSTSMNDTMFFNMTGGTIRNNQAQNSGGGIHGVCTPAITISGTALIYGNTAHTGRGGGVYARAQGPNEDVRYAFLEIQGGRIENNQAATSGGGVHVGIGTVNGFHMTGGTIHNNRALGTGADQGGGGISIDQSSWPDMPVMSRIAGGNITNNHANADGGGIFTMQHNYARPLPENAYPWLVVGSAVNFDDNTAGNGSFQPPANAVAATNIATTASTSAFDHALNNYDINFHPPVFEVTLDLGGGNIGGNTDDIVFEVGQGLTSGLAQIPDTPPLVRAGYHPVGWQRNGTGAAMTREDVAAYVVTGEVTFQMLWVINYEWEALRRAVNDAPAMATINLSDFVTENNNILAPPIATQHGQQIGVAITLPAGRNITLTADEPTTLTMNNSAQRHFIVPAGTTLTLGNNVTLTGAGTTANVMRGGVIVRGALNLNAGSAITNNRASFGGAAQVSTGGTITLNGGAMMNNQASDGGAIDMMGGRVIINSGTISNNTATRGGAIEMFSANSRVYLNNGTIANNTASLDGGGIRVNGANAAFVMTNGTLANNAANGTAATNGGGAIRLANGTATISGGTISGNTARSRGGGVYVVAGAAEAFTMTGGSIVDNTALNGDGGGIFTVQFNYGAFVETGYENLFIGDAVVFDGNTAGGGSFEAPDAVFIGNIQTTSSSVPGANHPLNNYDINYRKGEAQLVSTIRADIWNGNNVTTMPTGTPLPPLPGAANGVPNATVQLMQGDEAVRAPAMTAATGAMAGTVSMAGVPMDVYTVLVTHPNFQPHMFEGLQTLPMPPTPTSFQALLQPVTADTTHTIFVSVQGAPAGIVEVTLNDNVFDHVGGVWELRTGAPALGLIEANAPGFISTMVEVVETSYSETAPYIAHFILHLEPQRGDITGSVTDDGVAVEGATVTLIDGETEDIIAIVTTEVDGEFAFDGVRVDTHVIEVEAIGYEDEDTTVTVIVDDTVDVPIALTPVTVEITFDLNDGTLDAGELTYDLTFNRPYAAALNQIDVSRAHHTFTGWQLSDGTAIETDTIVREADAHTLYAQWTQNPGSVAGNVTSTYGLPDNIIFIHNARVELMQGGVVIHYTYTVNGIYTFPVVAWGTYDMRFTAEDHIPRIIAGIVIDSSDQVTQNVTLTHGDAYYRVEVQVIGPDPEHPQTNVRFNNRPMTHSGGGFFSIQTLNNGEAPEAGEIVVIAAGFVHEQVLVADVDFVDFTAAPAAITMEPVAISGTATESGNGAAIAGAIVHLYQGAVRRGETTTNAAGAFSFDALSTDSLITQGNYRVYIAANGFRGAWQAIEVEIAANPNYANFELVRVGPGYYPTYTVLLTVTGAADGSILGIDLVDADDDTVIGSFVHEEGNLWILTHDGTMPLGNIIIDAPGYVVPANITVTAGNFTNRLAQVAVSIEPFLSGRIYGNVFGFGPGIPVPIALPGARLELRSIPSNVLIDTVTAGAGGAFEFLDVALGAYSIQVAIDGFAPLRSDVELTYDGQQINAQLQMLVPTVEPVYALFVSLVGVAAGDATVTLPGTTFTYESGVFFVMSETMPAGTLRVTADGFVPAEVVIDADSYDDLHIANVTVTLEPVALQGTITNVENGAVISGATVTLRQGGEEWTTTTNLNGVYRFEGLLPGEYDVIVMANSFRTATDTVTVLAATDNEADFALVRETPIDNIPVYTVLVDVTGVSAGTDVFVTLDPTGGATNRDFILEDGRWVLITLVNAPTGTIYITADGEYREYHTYTIELTAASFDHRLASFVVEMQEILPIPMGELQVIALSGGSPMISGVLFEVLDIDGAVVQSYQATGAISTYTFRNLVVGDYLVRASRAEYGTVVRPVTIVQNQRAELDFSMFPETEPTYRLFVNICNSVPVPSITATLNNVPLTFANGLWTASGTEALEGELRIAAPGFRTVIETVSAANFNAVTRELIRWIVPEAITVTGTVQSSTGGAIANARIEMHQNGAMVDYAYTNADGQYVFTAVPIGAYSLKVSALAHAGTARDITVAELDANVENFVLTRVIDTPDPVYTLMVEVLGVEPGTPITVTIDGGDPFTMIDGKWTLAQPLTPPIGTVLIEAEGYYDREFVVIASGYENRLKRITAEMQQLTVVERGHIAFIVMRETTPGNHIVAMAADSYTTGLSVTLRNANSDVVDVIDNFPAFAMDTFRDIPLGVYTIIATRDGFAPAIGTVDDMVANAATNNHILHLNRIPEPIYTLTVDVRGVEAGTPLSVMLDDTPLTFNGTHWILTAPAADGALTGLLTVDAGDLYLPWSREITEDDYTDRVAAVIANIDSQNFGTLSGTVTNAADGVTALAGVTINLHNLATNAVVATTTTNADGFYEFDEVHAASYILRAVLTGFDTHIDYVAIGTGEDVTLNFSMAETVTPIYRAYIRVAVDGSFVNLPISLNGTELAVGTLGDLDVRVVSGETMPVGTLEVFWSWGDLAYTTTLSATDYAYGVALILLDIAPPVGEIQGWVTNMQTDVAVPAHAVVTVIDSADEEVTTLPIMADGSFTVTGLGDGFYTVRATAIGFADADQLIQVSAMAGPTIMPNPLSLMPIYTLEVTVPGIASSAVTSVTIGDTALTYTNGTWRATQTALDFMPVYGPLVGELVVTATGYVMASAITVEDTDYDANRIATFAVDMDISPGIIRGVVRARGGDVDPHPEGTPLAGVRVELATQATSYVASMTTGANGEFYFEAAPGAYVVFADRYDRQRGVFEFSLEAGQEVTHDFNLLFLQPPQFTLSLHALWTPAGSGAGVEFTATLDGVPLNLEHDGPVAHVWRGEPWEGRLVVSAPGFICHEYDIQPGSHNPDTNVLFRSFPMVLATGTVEGTIFNETTGFPLAGATVRVLDGENNVIAAAPPTPLFGAYSFNLPIGTWTIEVTAPGFAAQVRQVTVELNDEKTQNFHLVPEEVPSYLLAVQVAGVADGITVNATFNGAVLAVENDAFVLRSTAGPVTGTLRVSAAGYWDEIIEVTETDWNLITRIALVAVTMETVSFDGLVLRTTDETPIEGAIVRLFLNGVEIDYVETDEYGVYSFEGIAPGNYTLLATRTNYHASSMTPVTFSADRELAVGPTIYLTPLDGPPEYALFVEVQGAVPSVITLEGVGLTLENGVWTLRNTEYAPTGLLLIEADGFIDYTATIEADDFDEDTGTLVYVAILVPETGDIGGYVRSAGGGYPAIEGAEVQLINEEEQVVAETTTNEHGAYSFADVLLGNYTVRATAVHYGEATVAVIVEAGVAAVADTLYLAPLFTLNVEVAGVATGTDVTVTVDGVELTLVNGVWTLTDETQLTGELLVVAQGYEMETEITVTAADFANVYRTAEITVEMIVAPGTVTGTVYNETDNTPVGAGIAVYLRATGFAEVRVYTDANGVYTFERVPAGTYTVQAVASELQMSTPVTVTVTPAEVTEQDIILPPLPVMEFIFNVVVVASIAQPGLTPEDQNVTINGEPIDWLNGIMFGTTRDAIFEGELRIVINGFEDYVLDFGTDVFVPDPLAPLRFSYTHFAFMQDLQLDEIGSARGTITNELTGQPINGATVRLLGADGEDARAPRISGAFMGINGGHGTYLFNDIALGQYTIVVIADGFLSREVPVTLSTAGQIEITDIVLTPGVDPGNGNLRGIVTSDATGAPIQNATVRLIDIETGATVGTTTSYASGVFAFSNVEAGEYIVRVLRTGYETVQLLAEVEAGLTTDVTVVLEQETVAAQHSWIVSVLVQGVANENAVEITFDGTDMNLYNGLWSRILGTTQPNLSLLNVAAEGYIELGRETFIGTDGETDRAVIVIVTFEEESQDITIVFHRNNDHGSAIYTTIQSELGEVIPRPQLERVRVAYGATDVMGYAFLGWFTASVGGTRIDTGDVSTNAMLDDGYLYLYAQWATYIVGDVTGTGTVTEYDFEALLRFLNGMPAEGNFCPRAANIRGIGANPTINDLMALREHLDGVRTIREVLGL